MLISFDGKGCVNCPFYHYFYDKGYEGQECVLHRYKDAATDEKFPELYESDGKKPDGCPFKGFPGNIEIQAMDTE